jgi:hypothetical protein
VEAFGLLVLHLSGHRGLIRVDGHVDEGGPVAGERFRDGG